MDNKITAIITREVTDRVMEALRGIYSDLPFLIELSPVESKRMTRMEAGRVDFVNKAYAVANANERLRPQFFDLAEMEKDIHFCRDIDVLIPEVEKLLKQMVDTRSRAGHEAYTASLEIHNTTKRATAQGIPGAQLAYEELKTMFAGQGNTTKDEPDGAH